MTAALNKAVGRLEGRMSAVERTCTSTEFKVDALGEKIDELIMQSAITEAVNKAAKTRYGRRTALVSGVVTAIVAALIKFGGGD